MENDGTYSYFDDAFVMTLQHDMEISRKTIMAITDNNVRFDKGYNVSTRAGTTGVKKHESDVNLVNCILLDVYGECDGSLHIEIESKGLSLKSIDYRMLRYAIEHQHFITDANSGTRIGVSPRQYVVCLQPYDKASRLVRKVRMLKWDLSSFALNYEYNIVFLDEWCKGTLFEPLYTVYENVSEDRFDIAASKAARMAMQFEDGAIGDFYVKSLLGGFVQRFRKYGIPHLEELQLRLNQEEESGMLATGEYSRKIWKEMQEEAKLEERQETTLAVTLKIICNAIRNGMSLDDIRRVLGVEPKDYPEAIKLYEQLKKENSIKKGVEPLFGN